MFVKIYTKFFLSSGGYNFKINCLKDSETQNVSSYLAEQFGVISIPTRVLLLAIGLILRRNRFYVTIIAREKIQIKV